MRKFVAGLIIGVVIAMGLPVSASDAPAAPPVEESAPIKLVVNGQEITLPDAQPVVVNGQVMIPVVAFSEVAGFDVRWDEAAQTVTVTTRTAIAPAPAQEAAEPAVPLTITEDGVTYYEGKHLRALLESLYPDARIFMGMEGITIDGQGYKVVSKGIGRTAYTDVRTLIEAEVLTQEDLDQHYGK